MRTRFIALIAVVASVACLQAAPATVSSKADGITKVMSSDTSPGADFVKTGIPDSTYAMAQYDPVAVLVDVRPQAAATKVVAFNAPVHRKVAYRAPVVSAWLICAASPPTAPLGPDNPALAASVQNTPRLTWYPPADYDPAIKGRQNPDLV